MNLFAPFLVAYVPPCSKRFQKTYLMKTTSIHKILVPVDFSETAEVAAHRAASLAKDLNAKLYLIHAAEDIDDYAELFPVSRSKTISTSEVVAVLTEQLDLTKDNIHRRYGLDVDTVVVEGDIGEEIARFAELNGIDLIVMGTHGASGFQEFLIGSNSQHVVASSKTPVLTMQKNAPDTGFRNILIPLDNAMHSREKVGIAMAIASIHGARIHIIGLPDSEDTLEVNRMKIKCRSVEDIVKAKGLEHVTHIIHRDNLAEAAMNYAETHDCDLIVINTGHESESEGALLGAFAENIVNHSKVPVLSFRHSEGHFSIDTPGYGIS